MRVIVNLNTGSMIIPCPGALTDPTVPVASAGVPLTSFPAYLYKDPTSTQQFVSTFPGSCPIMLAPLQASGLCKNVAEDGETVSGTYPANANIMIYPGVAADVGTTNRSALVLSVSIAKVDPIHSTRGVTTTIPNHAMNSCRIYAPIIDMEPSLITKYLTQFKTQGIKYRDVLQFVYPGVSSGQTFTYQLANGVTNAKRLIIMPFYNNSAAISLVAPTSALIYEPLSPFDSAPATVAPMSCLRSFNVLISNMNVFQRNIDYSFENFLEEMSVANSINGGLDTGLTSGLIGFREWSQNYRYYVVDLSRRLAGDNTPKSVTIMGTNASESPVDYYCFIEYERNLELDVESGHISVSSN
jgi:hypothetical protein